jgi:hypothetical protein
MKRSLSIVLFTMIFASPVLAQSTTQGGGPGLPVQSSNGTGTLNDTTQHTTHGNGVVVSGSKGSDGKQNGSSGSSSDTTGGSGGASYEDPH